MKPPEEEKTLRTKQQDEKPKSQESEFNSQKDNLLKTDNSESNVNKDQTKNQSDERADSENSKNNDIALQESVLKQQSESEKPETSRDVNTGDNNDDIPTKVDSHEESPEG